jgi:hypothetical protein
MSDARLWHPWLRINRVLRVMCCVRLRTGARDRRAAHLHAAAGRRAGGVLVLLRELQGLLPERPDVRQGVDQGSAEIPVEKN